MTNPIDYVCFKIQQVSQTMVAERIVNPIPNKQWRLVGWNVPDKGWVKINYDGAMKHDKGLAAAGG